MPETKKPVGVVGAGSFGIAVANLLAENRNVILYSRHPEFAVEKDGNSWLKNQELSSRIIMTDSIEELTSKCDLICPIISSSNFRGVMRKMSPHLLPSHIMIHGTKGFDVILKEGEVLNSKSTLSRARIHTMSEIILQETVVKRVGCISGPNLAGELARKQPAAAVVASRFNEVLNEGQVALRSTRFQVYGSKDITGVEIAGVLKNVIAIGAGMLAGLGFGDNARALLISRGMVEMIYLGKTLGGDTRAFFGLAGVGDLIATCSSPQSRNYTVGYRIAKGEKLVEILASMEEVAEGVNTLKVMKALVNHYKTRSPITEILYQVLFNDMPVKRGLSFLMEYKGVMDVDYI